MAEEQVEPKATPFTQTQGAERQQLAITFASIICMSSGNEVTVSFFPPFGLFTHR